MAFEKGVETAQDAAARLGITARAIQKQAAAGKIPGAVRHGRTWLIPADYDPAALKEKKAEVNGIPDVYQVTPFRQAMPLMNSAYPIGGVMDYIHALPDADDRQIALAEYYFFSGQAEKCAQTAEPYLDSHDPALRYSASLLCTFHTARCPQCNALLEQSPGHRQKRFCSPKCRISWWAAHPEQMTRKKLYPVECQHCGGVFMQYGSRPRKFCSRGCYLAHRYSQDGDVNG